MASKQIDFIAAGLVDSSGNPLQSGTVELYEAGTSTPVTGYADAALGSSLGSTITLDSRGAKLIFVDGLVDLKIIVKDSAGTTINTYDGLDYDASGPTVIDSDPEIVLQNTDQEDTDGGRQSIIRHKGEQSGGEVSTLATVTASHDGSSDDEKGKYEIKVNDGNDGNSPSIVALSLKSTLATFGTAVTTGGALTVPSGGATIASGNLTLSAGNIVVSGTVDGVDVATLNTNYTNHAADATIHFTEGSIDHGNITGLGDDDHTQYSLVNGTRAFTGNVTINASANDRGLDLFLGSNTGLEGPMLRFAANNNGPSQINYAAIKSAILDGTVASEDGRLEFYTMSNGTLTKKAHIDETGAFDLTGNITLTGTVDGVDIATDVVVRDGSIPFTGAVSIQQSNPGSFTPDASTDDLVISASGNCGINIVSSGTSDYAGIRLGDIADPSRALVDYEHANETMRIISDGVVDIQSFFGGTTSNLNMNSGYSLFGNELRVVETSTTTEVFRPRATSTVYTGTVVQALCDTSSSTGFNFFTGVSSAGGATDTRFLVRGDGNVYNDNNVYSTPADYAEWIESSTGEKIPVGTTVVIESSNGKIRAYNENTDVPEDIVGVIRPGNGSSLEANASTFCWTGKYLKNIYGGYEYDENGDLQLNPDFDENAEYIPRVDRDEYCLMGFIGQIQITKGQTTHPSWRKMRDLSDDVELWIVR